MFAGWTDYPISPHEFGRGRDFAGKLASVRRVTVLSYDGDKRCRVRVAGFRGMFEIKLGYIYPRPGRCQRIKAFTHETALRRTHHRRTVAMIKACRDERFLIRRER
jgi:hypothetical protein